MASQQSDIAVLRSEMARALIRIDELEKRADGYEAILNKSWGGAIAIFLFGSIAGGLTAFWANIQKALGH